MTLDQTTDVDLDDLIAGHPCPCAVFGFAKDMLLPLWSEGQVVDLELLLRNKREFGAYGFVSQKDHAKWRKWQSDRHPQDQPVQPVDTTTRKPSHQDNSDQRTEQRESARYRGIVNDYVLYAQGKIHYPATSDVEHRRVAQANQIHRAVAEAKNLEWYFRKPPDEAIFNHSSRVSYLCALFVSVMLPTVPRGTVDSLVEGAIAHELEGDPAQSYRKPVSARTMHLLEQAGCTLSEQARVIIEQQDELFSGEGSPKGLQGTAISPLAKLFCIANHFDHLRLANRGGTRRVRFERVRELMTKRQGDYDPKIWQLFWPFIEKTEVLD